MMYSTKMASLCESKMEDAIDDILKFPYKLDSFQQKSIESLLRDEHVLVTAHTSAGKSTVAEFAVALSLRRGKRVIYTSPIKALSNQKFGQFKKYAERYGCTADDVGILTGDIKINPDAKILVATTEIVRNLLFNKSDVFDSIGAIILDEVHYIKDRDRGHIWEETIAMTPENVLLVMLSASIGDAHLLSDWVTEIKGKKTNLITTQFRPVPLIHYYFHHHDFEIHQIMDNAKNVNANNYFPDRAPLKPPGQKAKYKELNLTAASRMKRITEFIKLRDYVPCLVFSFSRKKCEIYAEHCDQMLLDSKESIEACNVYDYYVKTYIGDRADQLEQVWRMRDCIKKGVAAHHSGLIPMLKEVIEILFERKLIKLLFVTETFSVGINMPTRCVVFSDLQKWDGSGNRLLLPEEYLQMAGRAGRRGLDTSGIVIYAPIEKPLTSVELKQVIAGRQAAIESKFQIDPEFVLHCLVAGDDPKAIANLSFYRNQFNHYVADLENDLKSIDLPTESEALAYVREINNLEQSYLSIRSQKDRKQNRRKLRELKEQKVVPDELISKYCESIDKQANIQSELSRCSIFYESQFSEVIRFLNKLDLCHDSVPTQQGIVASNFKEIPGLFAAECLEANLLDSLDGRQLLGVLCAFVDDRNVHSLSADPDDAEGTRAVDRETLTDQVVIDCVSAMGNILKNLQSNYEDHGFDLDYNMTPAFVRYGMLWFEGITFVELSAQFTEPIYAGNFVKNMLKVNTLIDEFANACQLLCWPELQIKLHNVQTVIMHDIVTSDSIYLHIN